MGSGHVFGFILIFIGSVIVFVIRGIIKGQAKQIDKAEDGDFSDLLSMTATAFVFLGIGIIAAGAALLFIFAK